MRYRSLYSEWDRPSSAAKGNGGPDLKKNLLMVCSALLLLYLLPLILPRENEKDLEDVPPYVLDTFHIVYADEIADVLREALVTP